MVPFNQVLKLVARLDSQCLANFPWNGCLSLTRYSGMLHSIVPYSLGIPYILVVPYFTSLGKRLLSMARRWPYIQRCGLICDSQSWAVGKQGSAIGNSLGRNNEHQNAAAYQPAVHVLQEELLHALRFLFANVEVVRRVQIGQRERFHGALHVKAVPVDHLDSFSTRLFRSASVQFYAVSQDLLVRSDFGERGAIPHARVQRATRLVREY